MLEISNNGEGILRRLLWMAGLLAAALGTPGGVMAQGQQPNVLLIVVDDLNDWVGVLDGHPQAKTPNIDTLAGQGTNFTNAQVAAPICNPSRVGFMTGISPGRSRVNENTDKPWRDFIPNAVTLNQIFRGAGYDTVGFGKVYHGGSPINYDEPNWDSFTPKPSSPMPPASQRPLNGLNQITLGGKGGGDWGELNKPERDWGDYKIATWARNFINNRNPNDPDPFFLAVGFSFPHSPWYVPPSFFDAIAFNTNNIVLPPTRSNDLNDVGSTARNWAKPDIWAPLTGNAAKVRSGVHAYLAATYFVDKQIGRVMNALDTSSFADNTVVVLVSDNGYHLSEKGTWQKNKLWEEDNHVPFMIRVPNGLISNTPARIHEVVNVAAIYPTLLELAGIPLPNYSPSDPVHRIDYRSLVPLLRNRSTAQWHSASPSFGRSNQDVSIRTSQYRFTLYANNFKELYNHNTDPNEWTNVAGLSQHQQLVANFTRDAQDYLAANHPLIGSRGGSGGGGGRIGDYVWDDADKDGIQDNNESGLSGVTVRLRDCSGNLEGSTTTAADGSYVFNGLAPGGYMVEFVAPSGFAITFKMRGTQTSKDSNADPATGLADCQNLAQNQSRLGIDAGMFRQGAGDPGSASIGDFVWRDTNGDGVQGAGEPGLGGVRVRLETCNATVLETVTTASDGSYMFDNLEAGDYQVHFVLPSGFEFAPRFAAMGGKDSDPFPNSGTTLCQPQAAGQSRVGIDAGMVPASSGSGTRIGDFVWRDDDGDGRQDAGEPGLSGVTVRLQNCNGANLATRSTAGDGSFLFNNLAAGSYRLKFVLPSGFGFSPRFVGMGGKDSDAIPADGTTDCKAMVNGQARLGLDAGMVPQAPSGSARIGDFVWHDLDADGRQDGNEPGLSGVTVRLQNCNGATLATRTTAGNGSFLFNNLAAGSYRLKFILPSGFGFSPRFVGVGGKDSDAHVSNGTTGCKAMTNNQARLGLDAGMVSN